MKLLATLFTFGFALAGFDAHGKTFLGHDVEYKDGDVVLQGYLAVPSHTTQNNPAVLVVHDWMGLSQVTKENADKLAQEGYIAFAVDIYGKGVRPSNPKEAAAQAGKYKSDRTLLRQRMRVALQTLRQQQHVAKDRIAVIGYCFGGTAALELARDGADVRGVVSFHGGLDTPHPTADAIHSKILVLHGADDPNVPSAQVQAFMEEMRAAKVDWQFHAYGNAVHSFTNPNAGHDNSKGAAYNALADARSWQEMKQFFHEIL